MAELQLRIEKCIELYNGKKLDGSDLNLKEFKYDENLENVTHLNLRHNVLVNVPTWVMRDCLQVLNLSNNKISCIPDGVDFGANLVKLDLHCNEIKELPRSVTKLMKLEELYLQYNQLEWLPDGMGNLKNLEILSLGFNKLKGIQKEVGELKKMRIVDLSGNGDLENVPLKLCRLHEMNELLHSKSKRREVIGRALHIRSAVNLKMKKNTSIRSS